MFRGRNRTASTGISSNYQRFQYDSKETTRKVQVFKEEFSKSFLERLESTSNVGSGKVITEVTYSPMGKLVQDALFKVLSSAGGAIPVVGPFVADFVTIIPLKLYEHYHKKQTVKRAAEVSNELVRVGEQAISKILEETSHELVRMFEQQIALLKTTTDVKKLAIHAVHRVFEVAEKWNEGESGTDSVSLKVESLIAALLAGSNSNDSQTSSKSRRFFRRVASGKAEVHLDTIIGGGVRWEASEVFCSVGLRVEALGGGFDYFVQPSSSGQTTTCSQKQKCGFRGAFFEWSESEHTFIRSSLDVEYSQFVDLDLVELPYTPTHRLVLQHELDNYFIRVLSGDKTAFRSFFNKINPALSAVLPVFRDVRLVKGISEADFSECDLSHIQVTRKNFKSSNFNDCRLVGSQWEDVDLQSSSLMRADLRWSVLSSVDLRGDTNLVQTNLNYALLAAGTQLTDNLSFGSAITERAHILTDKVGFTVLTSIETLKTAVEESAARQDAMDQSVEEVKKSQDEVLLEVQKLNDLVSIHVVSGIFNVPATVQPFVGRESSLESLAGYFASHAGNSAMAVVTGCIGVGKTQLGLRYVDLNRQKYDDRVRWIDASSCDTLDADFVSLAERLNLATSPAKSVADTVRDVMSYIDTSSSEMLFVFDNVTDRDALNAWLPRGNHHVILLSRDCTILGKGSDVHVETLQVFSEEESKRFIASSFAPNCAQLMYKTFGGLPLGLALMTSFATSNSLTVKEAVELYLQDQETILQDNSLLDVGSVFESFSSLLDYLSVKSSSALHLLEIASFLSGSPIAEKFLESEWSSVERLKLLSTLKRVGAIFAISIDGIRFFGVSTLLQVVVQIRLLKANRWLERLSQCAKMLCGATLFSNPSKGCQITLDLINGSLLPFWSCHAKSFLGYIDSQRTRETLSVSVESNVLAILITLGSTRPTESDDMVPSELYLDRAKLLLSKIEKEAIKLDLKAAFVKVLYGSKDESLDLSEISLE